MTKIFFCLLLLNAQRILAGDLEWFDGSLVLLNGEVRVGRIALEIDHDMVLFEEQGSRTVYPAHKIKSLYVYDKNSDINRRYVSLKQQDGARSDHHLYEIVIAGEVDIIRRKKSALLSMEGDALDYNYFIRYDDVLTPLKKFKKNVYPMLQAQSGKRLDIFIAMNRLQSNLPINSIRIIEYYNTLFVADESLARH